MVLNICAAPEQSSHPWASGQFGRKAAGTREVDELMAEVGFEKKQALTFEEKR